jgi:hypothetical protein
MRRPHIGDPLALVSVHLLRGPRVGCPSRTNGTRPRAARFRPRNCTCSAFPWPEVSSSTSVRLGESRCPQGAPRDHGGGCLRLARRGRRARARIRVLHRDRRRGQVAAPRRRRNVCRTSCAALGALPAIAAAAIAGEPRQRRGSGTQRWQAGDHGIVAGRRAVQRLRPSPRRRRCASRADTPRPSRGPGPGASHKASAARRNASARWRTVASSWSAAL